jgi:photosystem II stability/assembly factor-like uncharacterized protein
MYRLILSLVVSFIFVLSQTILSQVSWLQSPGPYGGGVPCVAVASNGIAYIGSNGAGIFRSVDQGINWSPINTGILNLDINAIAFNSSGHLFAAGMDNSGSSILRSTNNGTNWYLTALTNKAIRTLAINQSSGHIFAGTDTNGIYRSTDNGVSFMQINNGLTFRYVRSIVINSSGVIFAATHVGGVFRSIDNGDNWSQVNAGITNLYVNAVAINPVNGHIFAATGRELQYGAVYRTTNNGGIWTISTLTGAWVTAITINSTGIVYAGTLGTYWSYYESKIKRSTDGGGTWSESYSFSGYPVTSLAYDNSDSRIYAATGNSLYKSRDETMYFDIMGIGFTGQDVNCLFKKSSNGFIYAGTNWGGICRTTNNGLSWLVKWSDYLGDQHELINAIAVNSFGFIFGGGTTPDLGKIYICESQDGGEIFQPVYNEQLSGTAQAMAINYLDYIFAGTSGNGILRSIDNGSNWTQINLPNNNVHSLLSVDSTESIFAGTGGGKIFRSTNNGIGLIQVYNSPIGTNSVLTMAISPANVIYAGLDTGGIVISNNNGDTWTQYSFSTSLVNAIAFSANGHVLVGTGKNGVFESTNNGSSWIQINSGLTNTSINTLVFDNNNYLYCGTGGSSVFRSSQPIGIQYTGTEIPDVFSLFQNYPNPFNPVTKIRFGVPKKDFVSMNIFDALGREIATLVNQNLQPGTYEVDFDGSNFPSGVYFYRLSAGDFRAVHKMIILK